MTTTILSEPNNKGFFIACERKCWRYSFDVRVLKFPCTFRWFMGRMGLNVWNGDYNGKLIILININILKYWPEFWILQILVHQESERGKEQSLPSSQPGPAPCVWVHNPFSLGLFFRLVSLPLIWTAFLMPSHHLSLLTSLLLSSLSNQPLLVFSLDF